MGQRSQARPLPERSFTAPSALVLTVLIVLTGVASAGAALSGWTHDLSNGYVTMAPVTSGAPVTVKAHVQLMNVPASGATPLVALFQDQAGKEGVALYFTSQASGWFPVGKLRLFAPPGWVAAEGLRRAADEPNVYELADFIPVANREYEAALSYTPDGYLYISFHDVTGGTPRELYSVVVNARIPADPVYPAAAGEEHAAARGTLRLVAVHVASEYTGTALTTAFKRQLSWGLVLDPLSDNPRPVPSIGVFKGDSVGLWLSRPDMPAPGGVRLLAIQEGEVVELLSAPWRPGVQTIPLAHPLPPGKSTLRLEYVHGDYIEALGEKEVRHIVSWEQVPPADLSRLTPDDFSDDELFLPYNMAYSEKHMPYYLAHFHRLANAVREDGFIDIAVWRNAVDNAPYNARVMENILSLAYFYTTDRPWNPYYGSPALRARLEAALHFWITMQNDDGRFSEYGWERWNLPATAFATKFMGETLLLLHGGPPIDPDLLAAAVQAQRKAIMVTLTDASLYNHGTQYTNQFGNVWPGALAYLKLFPDPDMESALLRRFADAERDFQSPAGYYYEAGTVDWGYNMGTHRTNVRMTWHYARGSEMADRLADSERRWYEWLSYNALREPDGSYFLLNRGIESRQRTGGFARLDSELAAVIPLARAFATTQSEREESIKRLREDLAARWPAVAPLAVGNSNAYSPYPFLHQPIEPWLPDDQQRAAATALLPYLASTNFNHQRADSRYPLVLTYVRRPSYYAIFNAGQARTAQQRFGLGIVWHQQAGGLVQTQSRSDVTAWGTKAAASASPYEASIPEASYTVAGSAWTPRPGAVEMPAGDVTIRYRLGENGEKSVRFSDEAIEVSVQHPGSFVELIPLLVAPGDHLDAGDDRAVLQRGDIAFVVETAGRIAGMQTLPSRERVGRYEVVTLQLAAESALNYRMFVTTDEL